MALDYKTLQAVAASQPQDADDYCPECGRPWRELSPEPPHPARPFPLRAVLIGVIGLCLAITFGLRAWRTDRIVAQDCTPHQETERPAVATRDAVVCAAASMDPDRWTVFGVAPGQSGATERVLQRDLLLTAGGVAMVLVGVAALWPPRFRARAQRGTTLDSVAIRAAGGALLALVCLQIPALCIACVAVRLSLGLPLTWETLGRTVDEIVVLFSLMIGG